MGEFSSPESTLCTDSYSVSVPPPLLPQWHVKRPLSFCQKCRWLATPTDAYNFDATKSEWADYAAVQAQCGNLSGNELTRNLSRNIRPQSSQLAEPPWTDPDVKNGISASELISTSKKQKKKKAQAENELSNIHQKSSQARKRPPPPPSHCYFFVIKT